MTIRILEFDKPRTTAGNRFKLSDFHRQVIMLVCEYIRSNLNDDLSLEAIARKSGYGRSHFSRMFRMMHGVTIQTYVTKARMDVAAGLLRDTDQTIETIMRQVGYESKNGFVKSFKQCYDQTPSRYRGHARAAIARAVTRVTREEQP